jgi:hypothetical protein
MTIRLCFTIGISQYHAGLRKLPGAIRGAKAFAHWASKNGYVSVTITDDPSKEVTIRTIREELQSYLDSDAIERLIIYFAGHGFARDSDDEFWLLANIDRNPVEAIHVSTFRRQLEQWQIPQIAFFADACRTTGALAFKIFGSPVLEHSGGATTNAEFDRFLAASLGDPALSVAGGPNSDDYCLFTSVVVDALDGKEPRAIRSNYHPSAPAVVSDSLAAFVARETQNKASLLGRMQVPEINAGFLYPNDIYTPLGSLPKVASGSSSFGDIKIDPRETASLANRRDNAREALVIDALARIDHPILSAADQDRDHFRFLFGDLTGLIDSGLLLSRPAAEIALSEFELRDLFSVWNPMRLPFGGQASFGYPILFPTYDQKDSTIFIRTMDGSWAQIPRFRNLLAFLTLKERSVFFSYTNLYALTNDPNAFNAISNDYETALAPLLAGTLRASDAAAMADSIRYGKHENPIRGVIAAYLYDAVGDYENIRRMAYYYHRHNQPVPFDLALLGAERILWEADGGRVQAHADFSEVKDRGRSKDRPTFAQIETPRLERAPVAGIIPWMRQGWPVLRIREELQAPRILHEISSEIRDSPFTTLSEEAGSRLVRLLGYQRLPLNLNREA